MQYPSRVYCLFGPSIFGCVLKPKSIEGAYFTIENLDFLCQVDESSLGSGYKVFVITEIHCINKKWWKKKPKLDRDS